MLATLVFVAMELPGTIIDLVILVVDVPIDAVVLTTGTVIDFWTMLALLGTPLALDTKIT